MADWAAPFVMHTPADATVGDLDAYLSKVSADAARNASSIVLGVSNSLSSELSRPEAMELIRKRVPTVPIHLLSFDPIAGKHCLKGLDEPLNGIDEAEGIRSIRTHDLTDLVLNHADYCFFNASSQFHFVAPSGRHCATFVRVGDAVRSNAALDNFAFWLLPQLARDLR